MNRKKKIVVSITIITLALLGLTYGYYSTIIKGNTNSNKSLFVTTDRLILEYREDTSELQTVTNIRPGTTIEMKTFTATNGSNEELEYVAVLENITNTFTRQQDIVYTLTCTSTKGTCNGVDSRQFPSTGDLSGMVVNTIPGKATHTYTLTVTYLMSSENQNEDQGASFGAKVNIKDPNEQNPYNSNKELLSYNIVNNAILNKNGTNLEKHH